MNDLLYRRALGTPRLRLGRMLLVCWISGTLLVAGSATPGNTGSRPESVMYFEEYSRTPLPPMPHVLALTSGSGQLFYFGVRHTFHPNHWQVQAIVDYWEQYHPDLAFNEGGEPPVLPSRDETVSRFGEAGLVRYLAKRDGIAVRSLEPAREDEYALLLKEFTMEQIKVFYVLRGVVQFRKSRNDETVEAFVTRVLAGYSKESGLEGFPRSISEFEQSYADLFTQPKDWRDAPDAWFDPARREPATFANRISRKLSEFRDRYMVSLLISEVRKGKRVFAVVGGSHVIMQERALRAALEGQAGESKIAFWDSPRCGANLFNQVELKERLMAARQAGVDFVRLAPNKWLNGRPESRRGDFLLGRPEAFSILDTNDLALLIRVLDDAQMAGLKVVLTMLSLPGSRWRQHNGGMQEFVLWQDYGRQAQAIDCWRQLARALKDHPATVGYNLLNEPCPERAAPPRLADWFTGDYEAWQATVQDTPADLSRFYEKVVRAIREVDHETPIILDSGFYATPWAFKILRPVKDTNTLYSFHFCEPFAFTNHKNKGRFIYPGKIPTGESETPTMEQWDRARMRSFLQPVLDWQARWQIPSRRILVGEVGVCRLNQGAAQYLDDALTVFSEPGWHWAFYSFREDTWDLMDYELGEAKPPAAYWQAIEAGRMPGQDVYRGSPIFDVIQRRLHPKTARQVHE